MLLFLGRGKVAYLKPLKTTFQLKQNSYENRIYIGNNLGAQFYTPPLRNEAQRQIGGFAISACTGPPGGKK